MDILPECTFGASLVPNEVMRGCQIPWNWSYAGTQA